MAFSVLLSSMKRAWMVTRTFTSHGWRRRYIAYSVRKMVTAMRQISTDDTMTGVSQSVVLVESWTVVKSQFYSRQCKCVQSIKHRLAVTHRYLVLVLISTAGNNTNNTYMPFHTHKVAVHGPVGHFIVFVEQSVCSEQNIAYSRNVKKKATSNVTLFNLTSIKLHRVQKTGAFSECTIRMPPDTTCVRYIYANSINQFKCAKKPQ